MAFREFLRHNNDVVLANGHLDFLTNKANALRALERNEEALQLDSEITQAKTARSSVQSKNQERLNQSSMRCFTELPKLGMHTHRLLTNFE